MADINEILGRNINSVKELKDAIKELRNSLIGVDTESEQFKTTSQQLAAAQEELAKVTNAGKEANNAAKDSIVGLQQEYKNLYDTYKTLSEEERNSPFGKGMAESLSSLSEKINNSKKEVGNFTSNIGQYAQGATEAFNKLGISAGGLQKPLSLASTGAKGFNTALKTLSANPIILVITTLVAILVKAADAIKQNEELTNRLHEAMAVFQPVLDLISNAFDFLAKILVRVVEGIAKVASGIMSIIPGMKTAIKSHKDLAKATNDLTKAQREANVENSKKKTEVETLRAEAAATTDAQKKAQLLTEAKKKQEEIDKKNIALEKENLRIMQEYAKKTANSAEENEKLAAQQQKVNEAMAQAETNARMYNKQLASIKSGNLQDIGGTFTIDINVTQRLEETKEAVETTQQAFQDASKNTDELFDKHNKLSKKQEEAITKYRQLQKEVTELAKATNKDNLLDMYKDALKNPIKYTKEVFELIDKLGESNAAKRRLKKLTKELNKIGKEADAAIQAERDAGYAAQEAAAAYEDAQAAAKAAEEERRKQSQSISVSTSRNVLEEEKKKAEELFKQLQDNSKTELELLKEKYDEELALLEKYGLDTELLTKKYQAEVRKINREAALKEIEDMTAAREYYLSTLEESNSQMAQQLRVNDLETKAIPALDNLKNIMSGLSKEAKALVTEKGFSALGDEYNDIKDAVDDVNASLGTNITNFETLDAVTASVIQKIKAGKDALAEGTMNAGLNMLNELNLREELDMISGGFNLWDVNSERARNQAEYLEYEKSLLQESLINWEGTNEKKIELEQRLYEVQREIAENMFELQELQYERSMQVIGSIKDMTADLGSALDTVQSTWRSVTDSEVKAGKTSEKEAWKRKKRYLEMERVVRDFNIASILAELASGSFSIWHGYAEEVGSVNPQTAAAAGPAAAAVLGALNTKSTVTAIARQVGLAATATAQIAAAQGKYVVAKNNFIAESTGEGGNVGVAAAPALIDSNPYTYTRTVQTTDEEDRLNQPIFVTVTDIENGLGQRAKVTQETSF